jgi:hypothetical protein
MTGRKIDRIPSSQLLLAGVNVYATSFSISSCSSASDTPLGPPPVVVYSSPLVNSPVILPEALMSAVAMLPSITCVRHSEYSRDSPLSLGQRLGTRNAAASTPTRTQMVHRGQLPGPRPPEGVPSELNSFPLFLLDAGRSPWRRSPESSGRFDPRPRPGGGGGGGGGRLFMYPCYAGSRAMPGRARHPGIEHPPSAPGRRSSVGACIARNG